MTAQQEFYANRIRKKRSHLGKWARRTGVGAYRLYDRDIPETPLVLDIYQNAQSTAASLSLYKRPYEKDEAEEAAWLSDMQKITADTLEIEPERVFLKSRKKQRPSLGEQYGGEAKPAKTAGGGTENAKSAAENAKSGAENAKSGAKSAKSVAESAKSVAQSAKSGAKSAKMIVSDGFLPQKSGETGENREKHALKFLVNLSEHLDTGLFPDARPIRRRVYLNSAGKRVLNLFSYTGSFSVYAAAGGAQSVDSVDISAVYNAWALENLKLNNLYSKTRIRFFREDALGFLKNAKPASYGLVILNPGAFSNSKRMKGVLDLRRDHGRLIEQSLRLLAPGGFLYFGSPSRAFRLDSPLVGREILERDEDFRTARGGRWWYWN